jgi:hypothetical protein
MFPLKPLLPPAGLSFTVGLVVSAPVAAAGAEPEPVLPGVVPGAPLPSLPQALKTTANARTMTEAKPDRGANGLAKVRMIF